MDARFPDLQTATVTQLQDGLTKGHFTSLDLVKVSLSRTEYRTILCTH